LHDKLKELEKKDKKKGITTTPSSDTIKISELDLVKALNETEDSRAFLSLVNLEKFHLENYYEPEMIRIKESEESTSLFEEARGLFNSNKNAISQNF